MSKKPERRMKQQIWQRKAETKMRTAKKTYEIKLKVLNILGGERCANPNCLVKGGCTEPRALQIDHIQAVGKKRLIHKQLYKWILDNPTEARRTLQVLCANCNQIKKYEKGEGVKFSPLKITLSPIN